LEVERDYHSKINDLEEKVSSWSLNSTCFIS
jgi:hypothetical protein